ncbi:MAG: FAD-dependent oxidoreductase [Pyrinomonadaceae bacterium]
MKNENTEFDFHLGIPGFSFSDLFDANRLKMLTEKFYSELKTQEPVIYEALSNFTEKGGIGFEPKTASRIITDSAPYVSAFVARLFGVEPQRNALEREIVKDNPLWAYKFFVQRRAIRTYKQDAISNFKELKFREAIKLLRNAEFAEVLVYDEELAIATIVSELVEAEEALSKGVEPTVQVRDTLMKVNRAYENLKNNAFDELFTEGINEIDETGELLQVKAVLRIFEIWSAISFYKEDRKWYAFRTPHPTDYQNLVHIMRTRKDVPEAIFGPDSMLRKRDGFKLTDHRGTLRDSLSEIDYCLLCHERDKDSCSKGLLERDGTVKSNPLKIETAGCPLDEKISEMHQMKKQGDPIAALALVAIDNPMCAGTGHRICNDCMKGCIFQKQEPVNIPLVETSVLTDVLSLPYGFEIYSLFTRWNPLNPKRPVALPYNGKNILVVGMGPAGYTLSHYLVNEGFGVIGIDGLKIEPLNEEWTGNNGEKCPRPVKDIDDIREELDLRILSGFGGVSEYGITVRWDKNFLTMMQLLLARRDRFRAYGGVRFGGTITIDDAWNLGFDHIAIATGAGRPTIVKMKNNLIRGIRQASDFLMALQLTGAFKKDNLANLQVRLPAIVIGGGLTGIDTATEIFAYYPVQVEKMLGRFEQVAEDIGEEAVWKHFNDEEKELLAEFIVHGKAVRAERARAEKIGEEPDFVPLVRSWGGVKLVYRKRLQDSPAYRLNHEEVQKALEEGIEIVELMSPIEAVPDENNAVKALIFEKFEYLDESGKFEATGNTERFPARTVCVAAGTAPNVIYEKEFPGTFKLDKWNQYFEPHKVVKGDSGKQVLEESNSGFFTSYEKDGKFISYYGDNHPAYAGNVVKAMASAKDGYGKVVELFAEQITENSIPNDIGEFRQLRNLLDDQLKANVVEVKRLTGTIVEIIVRAPLQARKFKPGQFYRLQNFEARTKMFEGKKLLMEGLALTGAWVDEENGLLSLIVLEMGTSSRLCRFLEKGEEVIVMGPTGTPTEIPENETVMLAGGGLGNAVLFSIAEALKQQNNRVIYFAGYRDGGDLFKREEIEKNTDQVIWATDMGNEILPSRAGDAHFRGNIVEAMVAFAEGKLATPLIDLKDVDRMIVIGSDRMMNGVKQARYSSLKPYLKEKHTAIGSINSPMQCMMKEICAQCLQRHIDPETGEELFVFSCFNQDQNLDFVDFKNLNDRLRANSIQEKLSNMWLDLAFEREGISEKIGQIT